MIKPCKTADELWWMAIYDVVNHGSYLDSRAGGCKEIIGATYKLLDPLNFNLVQSPLRLIDPCYAAAELLWYLSGRDTIEMLSAYAPSYHRFTNDGHAFGAYGARWQRDPGFLVALQSANIGFVSQIFAAIAILKKDPNSRQCIVTQWNGGDLVHAYLKDKNDLPCTLTLKFYIRQEKLHMVVDMRSNDVWLGLPYDVYAFTTLQSLIAGNLGVSVGEYTHTVGSLHIYDKNYEKCQQVLKSNPYPSSSHAHNLIRKDSLYELISAALKLEETFRVCKAPEDVRDEVFAHPELFNNSLSEAVITTGAKWWPMWCRGMMGSPAMAETFDRLEASKKAKAESDGKPK